ncbi:hypothetical protein [Sabulicella glaciei]|uniref:Uncharacterized protein n=1 Tax=Sabulicella glaciei TaxID=2984948 RepID=A0ABT3NZV1_9PROT|nr:hypothetical protein [Roseococcus sp. MDT2-1-1]MCW8087697.1 hypothetical protein [Roseococcus sp. MDT2-1-1]
MDNTLFNPDSDSENLSQAGPDRPPDIAKPATPAEETAGSFDGRPEIEKEEDGKEQKDGSSDHDKGALDEGTQRSDGSRSSKAGRPSDVDQAFDALREASEQLTDTSARSSQALASTSATIAVHALRLKKDPNALPSLVHKFNEANRALGKDAPSVLSVGKRAMANPCLLLARLLMPAAYDKHRRTTVARAALRAMEYIVADAAAKNRTLKKAVRAESLRDDTTAWILDQGGVTSIYNRERALTRGKPDGDTATIPLRDASCQAYQAGLKTKACALILVTRGEDGKVQSLVEGQDSVDVVAIKDGYTLAQCKEDHLGQIWEDDTGCEIFRADVTSAILCEIADGRLGLWVAPKAVKEEAKAAQK